MIPIRNPMTNATKDISASQMRSTFGGPSNSSGESIVGLSRSWLFIYGIVTDNASSTYRDKYIRKVQDCKIFYRNEVYNVSDEYTFICMREGSGKYKCISDIKKFGFFSIFLVDIVIDNPTDQENSEYLESDSANRKRKCNSSIV